MSNILRSVSQVLTILFLGSSLLMAQTVHQVAAGTDVLKPAIDAAAAGDIIELTTSGGEYLSNALIYLNDDITIRGAEGLEEKPVIKYIGTASSAYVFRVPGSQDITLQNLDVDGDGTDSGAGYVAKYFLRLDNGDSTGTMIIRILDCDLHDFSDKIVRPYLGSGIDSLIFQNTTFYNGGTEGVLLYSGSSADPAINIGYAGFENCTFYNFGSAAIKGDTNPNTVVRVNHCTFYDIGTSGNPILFFDDILDVEIKNSIFEGNIYSGYCTRFESSASTFHHNSIWDVASWTVASATVSDTHRVDPLFNDPANGDFSLAEESPVLELGDDGEALGDLRWVDGGDASLPVELKSFTASAGDNQVVLKWSTASEIDNEAFIIERSTDSENFEYLAELEGQGSKSIETIYSYTDRAVVNGQAYYYRLADRDINGVVTYQQTVCATPNANAIDLEQTGTMVEKYALHSNYPNPFNPETTICFDIPTDSESLAVIKLNIFNTVGQKVATLYEGELSGGQYEMKWHATNQPTGIYFVVFQSAQFVATQKMMLIK